MRTTLHKALQELRRLPENRQTALVERLDELVACNKIDTHLAASEARGGETPSDNVFSELRTLCGGERRLA
jgi:hypothetical protein